MKFFRKMPLFVIISAFVLGVLSFEVFNLLTSFYILDEIFPDEYMPLIATFGLFWVDLAAIILLIYPTNQKQLIIPWLVTATFNASLTGLYVYDRVPAKFQSFFDDFQMIFAVSMTIVVLTVHITALSTFGVIISRLNGVSPTKFIPGFKPGLPLHRKMPSAPSTPPQTRVATPRPIRILDDDDGPPSPPHSVDNKNRP